MQEGNLVCVDPNFKEEAAAAGSMTAILNTHGEVCAVQKAHGIGLSIHQVYPNTLTLLIIFVQFYIATGVRHQQFI